MWTYLFPGLILMLLGVYNLARETFLSRYVWLSRYLALAGIIVITLFFLARSWLPIGIGTGTPINMVFVGVLIALSLTGFKFFFRMCTHEYSAGASNTNSSSQSFLSAWW